MVASTFDLNDALFSHDLLNPQELAAYIADQDFSAEVFSLKKRDFSRAGNSIVFHESQEFLATQELWPRQVEFLIKLFEEYCPLCSDLELLNSKTGLFGLTHEQIFSKVQMLQHGICPNCHQSKADFRNQNLLNDHSELIGVAGQRCMDPNTRIKVRIQNVPVTCELQDLKPGFEVMGHADGRSVWTPVKQCMGVTHPGHYKIHIAGRAEPFICSDSHQWIVYDRSDTVLTVNLREGDRIPMLHGNPAPITKIEKVLQTRRMIDIETGTHNFYSEDGYLLHNSGKSYICSGIANYVLHKYCILDMPAYKYFGLNAVPLAMTFCATSTSQIEETLWGQFKTLHDSSPWFQEYEDYLHEEEKRLGKTLCSNLKTYLSYKNLNIKAGFLSAKGTTLRGRTSILCAIDELGFFNQNASTTLANGQQVYVALNNSLMTTRGKRRQLIKRGEIDPLPVFMLNVSSPSDETDPIMTLLKQAQTTRTRVSYYFHFATWEINPDLPFECDEFLALRTRDPHEFWRNFGAKPSGSNSGWLQQQEILTASASNDRQNIQTQEHIFKKRLDNGKSYYYVTRTIAHCPTDFRHAHVITCDAGATQNSYCILVSRYDPDRSKYVLVGAIEIKPGVTLDGQPTHVHFERAKNLISDIAQSLRTVLVVFDRWNSMQTLQQIRDELGIDAVQKSPKLPHFNEFRARIESGQWSLPEMETTLFDPNITSDHPVTRLIKQTRGVIKKGKHIVPNGSEKDDLFRAWVLADMSMSENLAFFAKPIEVDRHASLHKIAKHRFDQSRYFQPTPLGAMRKPKGTGLRKLKRYW